MGRKLISKWLNKTSQTYRTGFPILKDSIECSTLESKKIHKEVHHHEISKH